MFTTRDLEQIRLHGLTPESVEEQLERFRQGFPPLDATAPATPGAGVLTLSPEQCESCMNRYDQRAAKLRVVKFVPASGAATRMFRDLYAFLSDGERTAAFDRVMAHSERLAFWPELHRLLPRHPSLREVAEAVVGPHGLGYGATPKGLVLFHRYGEEMRTPLEEHLVEGALYASSQGEARLHFTVSPEHREAFRARLEQVAPRYEVRYGVRYRVEFSEQLPSTDTLAVDPEGQPFRRADGSLLFRPSGHGALLENLGAIDADLIFIKNIDNVAVDRLKAETLFYKKVLAGLALGVQQEVFALLAELHRGRVAGERLRQIAVRMEERLSLRLPADPSQELLKELLDRPLRVCGMVRNEGAAGGGPFWVRDARGVESLQIAEASQLAGREELLARSTHFNPVDLVCLPGRVEGGRYDLSRYVDPGTGFISSKSYEGRPLRAMERPGLWNGSMARWNTVLVEVPQITFTPVKSVDDLLRSEHQV